MFRHKYQIVFESGLAVVDEGRNEDEAVSEVLYHIGVNNEGKIVRIEQLLYQSEYLIHCTHEQFLAGLAKLASHKYVKGIYREVDLSQFTIRHYHHETGRAVAEILKRSGMAVLEHYTI